MAGIPFAKMESNPKRSQLQRREIVGGAVVLEMDYVSALLGRRDLVASLLEELQKCVANFRAVFHDHPAL